MKELILLYCRNKTCRSRNCCFLKNQLKGSVRPGIINEIAARLMHKQKYWFFYITETKHADPGIVVFLKNQLKGSVRPGIINEIAARLMHKQKYNEMKEQLDYLKVHKDINYQLRSEGDNVFGSVHLSVPSLATEVFDLRPWYSVCRLTLTMFGL